MTHSPLDLRQYLTSAYGDEELSTFCSDYFRDVYENFTVGMSKAQKIQLLLDYCQRRDQLPNLLAALERDRPEQYRRRFASTVVETRAESPLPRRDPKQVFISHASHAREDAGFAHQLAGDLQRNGWGVWIAPDSIRPGEKWAEAINRGLEECGIFVVVLTPAAVASNWVKIETNIAIELAQRREAHFIPLRVADCRPSVLWSAFQRIDFVGQFASGMSQLLRELGRDACESVPPALALPPALQQQVPEAAPGQAAALPAGRSPAQAPGAQTPLAAPIPAPDEPSRSVTAEPARPAPPAIITLEKPIHIGLIRIPAGEFLMGSDPPRDKEADNDEKPQYRVYLSSFYIGKMPVTNEQYAAFVRAAEHQPTMHWSNGRTPSGKENQPVTNVAWNDSAAFCRRLSEATGQVFRLPTEAEWEKAARGDNCAALSVGGTNRRTRLAATSTGT